MSKELREAAEHGVEKFKALSDGRHALVKTSAWKALKLLADAWLAEHPVDDDEPVTEEWLLSVGFSKKNSAWASIGFDDEIYERYLGIEEDFSLALGEHDFLGLNAIYVPFPGAAKTRGDVRRLCKALGVPLKQEDGK
jgi:hypothetical protein